MTPWITAYGTHVISIREPTVEQVRAVGLEGFGFALAHLNRFTGHAGGYSVAQHCLNVAACVRYCLNRPDLYLPALFHDAAEAVTGDPSAPFKIALDEEWEASGELPYAYIDDSPKASPRECVRRISARLDGVIHDAFRTHYFSDMPPVDRAIIKRADLIMLATERRAFFDPLPEVYERAWLHGCGDEQPWASTTLAGGTTVAPQLFELHPRHVAAMWVRAARHGVPQ